MPPTFLLVAAIMATAYVSPVVLAAAVLALAIPRLRHLGATVVVARAIGAASCLALDGVVNLVFGDTPTRDGLLIAAGFGFVSAGTGWPFWRWVPAPVPGLRPPAP
jgi:hypothetical protein